MSATTMNWFNALDDLLSREAALAGLLDHGTMIGTAREFFVKRVLRSVLPRSVHIGSGRVISSVEAEPSKQIDIILYDGRFPFLELDDGIGLYFVEGVIGTIEVKSTLTTTELNRALDNCYSVTALSGTANDIRELEAMTLKVANETSLSMDFAAAWVRQHLNASTYIFAFKSDLSHSSIADVVEAWAASHGVLKGPFCKDLPRVIACNNAVCLLNDTLVRLRLSESDLADAKTRFGPEVAAVMGFWHTTKRFGFLASHIMGRVSQRLGTEVTPYRITMSIDDYLPVRHYAKEVFEGKPFRFLCWQP